MLEILPIDHSVASDTSSIVMPASVRALFSSAERRRRRIDCRLSAMSSPEVSAPRMLRAGREPRESLIYESSNPAAGFNEERFYEAIFYEDLKTRNFTVTLRLPIPRRSSQAASIPRRSLMRLSLLLSFLAWLPICRLPAWAPPGRHRTRTTQPAPPPPAPPPVPVPDPVAPAPYTPAPPAPAPGPGPVGRV